MRKIFMFFLAVLMVLGGAVNAQGSVLEVAAVEAEVPIIMYHLITEKPKYIGKYGITPADFEADLVYLKENGYTTIFMRDLVDFVERGVQLPEKPIMLTIDDGNSSDYNYVLPLLRKYDSKAVLGVIGSAADKYTDMSETNPASKFPKASKFPNLTWPQVRELHESGLAEIQSHSYDLHGKNGAGRKNGESAEAYHTRLLGDLQKFQKSCLEHLGYEPTAFIYPLGVLSDGSREVLLELGMAGSFSCQEGLNIIRVGEPSGLFRLNRVNRPSKRNVAEILGKLKTV
ncbi:MAG: polysaccharide deacetylase family protein [Defluviitaleaceae bacterium]|nr:polysaccharide deacetylase family protein [Defluviitaleaceae bacterium]